MSALTETARREYLETSLIDPSPLNRHPDDGDPHIATLAESIKAQGLLSPIAVRPIEGGRYEVIFGERRLMAHKLLGLTAISAEIRDVDATTAQALRLIENMQRKDLQPLEEAQGVKALLELVGGDYSEAAARLGKSETWVRRRNRLNNLSEKWLSALLDPMHNDYEECGHIRNSMEKMEELAMLPEREQNELYGGSLKWARSPEDFRDILSAQLMRLDKAPWDKNFSGRNSGKCSGCANRSDQEGDLFAPLAEAAQEDGEKKKPVFCLMRECWKAKTLDWIREELANDSALLPIIQRWGVKPNDAKAAAKALGVDRLFSDWSEWQDENSIKNLGTREIRSGIYCCGPEAGRIIQIIIDPKSLTTTAEDSAGKRSDEQKKWDEKRKKEQAARERRVARETSFRKLLGGRLTLGRPEEMTDAKLLLLVRAYNYHGSNFKLIKAGADDLKKVGTHFWTYFRKKLTESSYIYDGVPDGEREALCDLLGVDWKEILAELNAEKKREQAAAREEKKPGAKKRGRPRKEKAAETASANDGGDVEPEEE